MPKIEKTLLANGNWGRNYTIGRSGKKVEYIGIHYTATLAPAWNNLRYFASKYVGASAHYFIDINGDLYQSVLEKDTAWSVGASKYKHPKARNTNSVNIEVVAGNNEFTAAQKETLEKLVNYLMSKYDIPKANVLRHYDITGKKCPAWYVAPLLRWTDLRNKIASYIKPHPKPETPAAPKPAAPAKPATKSTYNLARLLKVGSKGDDVKALQKAVGVASDGIFGKNTDKAVRKFQQGKKLKADGMVGALTAKALGWTFKSAAKPKPVIAYYKKYTGTSPSIVAALNSIKVGSTFANRKKIAKANGISNYSGTATQNTKLLKLLKQGKLKKA